MNLKEQIKRRTFLGSSFLAASAVLTSPLGLNASNLPLNTTQSIFASENGNIKNEPLFVVGFVSSNENILIHEAAINTIRGIHNYKSTLSYSSNDKFKVSFAKDVINYFLEAQDLFFKACILKNDQSVNMSPNTLISKKLNCYELLFELGAFGKDSVIVAKPLTPFGPSQSFINLFSETVGVKYETKDSFKSNLLQLSNLLSGCLLSEAKNSCKDPLKKEITSHLVNGLGLSSLSFETNYPQKFKIIKLI